MNEVKIYKVGYDALYKIVIGEDTYEVAAGLDGEGILRIQSFDLKDKGFSKKEQEEFFEQLRQEHFPEVSPEDTIMGTP